MLDTFMENYMRTFEDVMNDMPFEDAEILSGYIMDRDEHFNNLDDDRRAALERALRAEQDLNNATKKLLQTEAKVLELTSVVNAQQQSLSLAQIKLGGIAMLLQGK